MAKLLLLVAALCVQGAGSQLADGVVQAQAQRAAAELARRIRLVSENVTQSHVLQGVIDGAKGTFGAQARTYSDSSSLVQEQARIAADDLVALASPLLQLRDAAAEEHARQSTERRQADQPEASRNTGGTPQDIGIDADQLRQAGVLREAALDADIRALDPAAVPSDGSLWFPFVSRSLVNLASSAVTLPQYCMRIGIPSFGSAYSSPSHRGDVAEAILGGLAPRDGEGKYPCVTRNRNLEQQSLDPSVSIYCLTRLNVRVLMCGSKAEMMEVVRFLNASAALDQRMRSSAQSAGAAGLLWQRIAHSHAGAERSFPAFVWKEAILDPYERYDPRVQSWFWAAASAPRALVVVLDTGAAMEEFDRRDISLRVVAGVLRSLGPADLVAFVAARDSVPRVFGCAEAPRQCELPQANASGLRLCASTNATVEWMMGGAASSFLDSTFGLCDLGHGVDLALKLIEAETDAWASGGATASAGLLPRPQIVVVASARGWAAPDSVRTRADNLKVAIHAVSVGASESAYERAWLRHLACGTAAAPGALSHIPYRYVWQQVVGGWFRLAARKFQENERIVAVSALRLSGHSGVPVVTLSAPFYGRDSSESLGTRQISGVVAMDVSPGPIFLQLARNTSAHIQARMDGAHPVSWWRHSLPHGLVEVWVVESSGLVIAHPGLPHHSSGFTHLRDLEGPRVFSILSQKWSLGDDECAGPVFFTTRTWSQDDGPWRLGMPQQRAAYMAKLGDVAQHLDAIFILVFGVGRVGLSWSKSSSTCQQPTGGQEQRGLALTRRQPGFPLIQRNASGLVHHRALTVRPLKVATTPGIQVGEALYGSLGNISLSCSVYTVSRLGLQEPGSASGLFADPALEGKAPVAVEGLNKWLLVVNLTSTGQMIPAPPSDLAGGGLTERASRDVLATSTLDAVWKEAWAVRQQLQDSGVLTSLLALWRFLTVVTPSGTVRVFPGHILPDNIEWTATASYVRTLEGGSAGAVASVAGPYAHPIDGTRTVSIASVVWEAGGLQSEEMAVVAVEFTYAGFVLGALDTLDACAFLPNQRWCMLLDQHAGVVAVSSSKLTHSKVEGGVFLGEIEPRLLGGLEKEGLLVSVDVAVRHGGGGKGRVRSGLELRLNSTGVILENITSWDGVQCRDGVTFALEPVSGTNLIIAVASGDATSVAAPCGSPQIAPITRAMSIERLQALSGQASDAPAPSSQCKPRSSPCSSCYLSVPVGSKPLAAGDGVVGSDAAQWTREAQASEAGGGEDDCELPTSTLVRAQDGGAAGTSTCVWWRRRAGWC